MNINSERESEALNYTQSQRAGISKPLGCTLIIRPCVLRLPHSLLTSLLTSSICQADGKSLRWTGWGLRLWVSFTLGLFLNLSCSVDWSPGLSCPSTLASAVSHQGRAQFWGNTVG